MFVFAYRLALRVYPKSFRDEYEQEMLSTFKDLLGHSSGFPERLSLCLRSVAEVAQWAPREQMEVADAAISTTPNVILWGYVSSVCLLAPFCLATAYRIHMLADREPHPRLGRLIVHGAAIYERFLPTLALVSIGVTGIWFWRTAINKNDFRYFLGLGLIGTLAVVALI